MLDRSALLVGSEGQVRFEIERTALSHGAKAGRPLMSASR